jgi:DNA sulfur modification protein DndB
MTSVNRTLGNVVAGVALDDNRFSGRMMGAQLLQMTVDPRKTEDTREVEQSTELAGVRSIRLEVQRLFEGAKRNNVPKYAHYIADVHRGQDGMAPPIILFTERKLDFEMGGEGCGLILVPFGVKLVAIDGETQLAARFEAANIDAGTTEAWVPVVICHGRTIQWARQVFHDLNLLAIRPNAAVGLAMDERDPLTHVARQIEQRVPFFTGRVNTVRRQLKSKDPEVVTITGLRGACVTFAEGIGGVKHGTRPVYVEKDRVPQVTDGAVEWFRSVTEVLGPAMEDRKRTLAAAPPVLAAIGALGHELLEIPDTARRKLERERLLEQLRLIDWNKAAPWEGVAGKFTSRGTFSVGGTKETAYAVYRALSDRTDAAYKRIRGMAMAMA